MVLAGDPATNQVVFLAATHRPRAQRGHGTPS